MERVSRHSKSPRSSLKLSIDKANFFSASVPAPEDHFLVCYSIICSVRCSIRQRFSMTFSARNLRTRVPIHLRFVLSTDHGRKVVRRLLYSGAARDTVTYSVDMSWSVLSRSLNKAPHACSNSRTLATAESVFIRQPNDTSLSPPTNIVEGNDSSPHFRYICIDSLRAKYKVSNALC